MYALAQWAEFSVGPLKQILFSIDLSNSPLASSVLGAVCDQFWLLCSNGLCPRWSHHCHIFKQKCRHLTYYNYLLLQ